MGGSSLPRVMGRRPRASNPKTGIVGGHKLENVRRSKEKGKESRGRMRGGL